MKDFTAIVQIFLLDRMIGNLWLFLDRTSLWHVAFGYKKLWHSRDSDISSIFSHLYWSVLWQNTMTQLCFYYSIMKIKIFFDSWTFTVGRYDFSNSELFFAQKNLFISTSHPISLTYDGFNFLARMSLIWAFDTKIYNTGMLHTEFLSWKFSM